MSWFLDPFQSEFMQHAAIVAAIVGILAPAVGVWMVLRSLAYLGDAMSHATLGGVAVAVLLGWSVTVGALAAGLLMAVLIALLSTRPRLREDAIIGVVETILFAIGVIVITKNGTGVDLSHYLFGQITTVSDADIATNAALAVVALGILWLVRQDLLAATFDPLHAVQVGIHVTRLRYVLLVLVSVTVVVSLSTVGLLMSVAMLITPAAAARLVTDRIGTMTAVACGIGVTSALGGLVVSYHLSSPPGATIALVAAGWLLALAGLTSTKGRIASRRRHRQRRPQPARQPTRDHGRTPASTDAKLS